MKKGFMLLVAALLLTGCGGDLFDTHPYDVDVKGETGINARQAARIEASCAGRDTLRVAMISDSHLWHSDLEEEIRSINARKDVDFVVHMGDVTDTGTTKEYLWARNILGKLQVPCVVLMGNHDMLATGKEVYGRMFGEPDFSFVAGRTKFVCVNTNAAEYAHLAAAPDFDFMERETTARREEFDRTVVLMHAPPYCEQFDNNVARPFRYYLSLFPNLLFCVYGHLHETTVTYPYGDGLAFYGVGCVNKRQYRVFIFRKDGYEVETVDF